MIFKSTPIIGDMHYGYALLIFILFYSSFLYGQEEIGLPNVALPPTPEAAAFNQYIDQPVSPYTGIPDISIPIYTVRSKELSLPISLSYHASGQKVEAFPTWVGMGWTLNVGGLISRSVVGLPDDLAVAINQAPTPGSGGKIDPDGGDIYGAGYLYHSDSTNALVTRYDGGDPNIFPNFRFWNNYSRYQDLVIHNSYDIEPDIFSFNFAGYSGKFVFDSDSTIQIIPKQPLLITPYHKNTWIDSMRYCTGPNGESIITQSNFVQDLEIIAFDVTVPDGTIYKFEVTEKREINKGHSTTYNRYDDRFKFLPAKPFPQSLPRQCELNTAGCPGSQYNLKYNSTWKLTKIISANRTDSIMLIYEDEKLLELSNTTTKAYVGNMTFPPESSALRFSKTLTISELKRVSEIQWAGGNVFFDESVNVREDAHPSIVVNGAYENDIPGSGCYANESSTVKALERIRIEDGMSKIFNFGLSYLTSPGINGYPTEVKPYFRRLRLDSLWEETPNNVKSPHVFHYNPSILPDRRSYEQDFWGYYNGNGEDTFGHSLIPRLYCYLDDPILDITSMPGSPQTNTDYHKLSQFSIFPRTGLVNDLPNTTRVDRQSSLSHMMSGILEKRTLPTGGSISYEYEMHDFRLQDHEDVSGSLNIKGGGLRIAKTTLDDDVEGTPSIVKTYKYQEFDENTGSVAIDNAGDTISSGKIFSVPQYARLYQRFYPDRLFLYDKLRYQIQSSPMNGIETSYGSNVTYGSVAEIIPNNGRTIRFYTQPADFGTDIVQEMIEGNLTTTYDNSVNNHFFGELTTVNIDGQYIPLELNPDFYPFPPNPNYDFMRGDLLKKVVFNETGQKLQTVEHTYTLLDVNGNQGFDRINSFTFKDDLAATWLRYGPYYYISAWKVLESKTETTFDPATGQSLTTQTNYGYANDKHLQQTSSEYTNSEGRLIRKELRYPEEAETHSVETNHVNTLGLMWDESDPDYRHMVGVPIEVLHYEDGQLISKTANKYKMLSPLDQFRQDLILIDRSLNFPTGGLDDMSQLSSEDYTYTNYQYDEFGNVIQYSTNDGMSTVLIWGYDHRYPVAKVENVTLADLNGLYTDPSSGALNTSTRQSILSANPDATVTLYQYKLGAGISKIIDTNGYTSTYLYDEFGRLIKVVDDDGNVLSQNEYNFKK